jgi:hypothetical protein
MIILFNSDNSIVSRLVLLALLALDYPGHTAFQKASGKRRLIHQHEDVYRIAVFSPRGRNKPKVIRKRHARRQNFCELENFLIRIERVLISGCLWASR